MESNNTANNNNGRPLLEKIRSGEFNKDLIASIVVFLVALPLCMGIAIACGMPAESGIISGIVGGLVAGSLGGCPLQVTGPAAGLVVLVTDFLKDHGPEKFALIVLFAGIFQLVAGLLGIARWFRAVTPAIINGMLAGIGVLIFASQFHVMVDDAPKGTGVNNILSIPAAIWKAVIPDATTSHQEAAAIGMATILILILWDRFTPKKLRVLPGSLIAVTLATLMSAIFVLPVRHVELPDSLWQGIHFLSFPAVFAGLTSKQLILDAIAVALIASAETLLTAQALDKMHTGARTNFDRELAAQGASNAICGVIGVLPVTGVMVRSGVNVNAGAKTRLSSILHGIWLLLFVSFLPFIVKLVPVSSLAALLVYTGYKLANFKVVKELIKYGRSEVAIYFVTVATIVCVDLLTGVFAGIALATAKLLYAFSHLEIRMADDTDTNKTHLWLSGAATFLNLPRVAEALEGVRPETELHLHLEALDYIDHACLDLIMSWDKLHQSTGGTVVIDWSTLGAVFRDRRRKGRPGSTKEFRRMTVEGLAPAVSTAPQEQQQKSTEEK